MARNWHYLRQSRQVGWPKSQVVVSLLLRELPSPNSSVKRLGIALDGWGAVAWRDDGRGPCKELQFSGRDVPSLWRMLGVLMRRGERLWVWIRGACHAMSIVGGWPIIRCGKGALCVLSDTPTIIDCGVAGLRGSLRFLDLRNCGIDCLSGATDSVGGAICLSIQLRAYQELMRGLDLGGLRCTVAAQAWHGWRYRFLQCPVEVHTDERRLMAEKYSCFGGRCEVLRIGAQTGPVYELDASAHYPSCAVDSPLPARTCRPADLLELTPEQATARGVLVIARGRVYTETPCVPCNYCIVHKAPRIGEKCGKWRAGSGCDFRTVFPVGSWPATYCWPEVEIVRSEGGWFDAKEWWGYESANPCERYMRRMWAVRLSHGIGNKREGCTASKLLANSLVGRIGALGRTWTHMPEVFHPEPWDQWWEPHPTDNLMARWRTVAGRTEVETIRGWGDESVPAVAAWVYCLGRVRLYQWMKIAGFENIYYVDTDSLWTNQEGLRRITEASALRPGEMGGLRVKSVQPWARFYGQKHYDSPQGIKWAGRPKELLSESEDRWAYTYSESPGRAARNGRPPVAELLVAEVPNACTYRAGVIGANGRTFPHEVYEDEQV